MTNRKLTLLCIQTHQAGLLVLKLTFHVAEASQPAVAILTVTRLLVLPPGHPGSLCRHPINSIPHHTTIPCQQHASVMAHSTALRPADSLTDLSSLCSLDFNGKANRVTPHRLQHYRKGKPACISQFSFPGFLLQHPATPTLKVLPSCP